MLEGTTRQTGVLVSGARAKWPQEVENMGGWFSSNQPYNSLAKYLQWFEPQSIGAQEPVLPLTPGVRLRTVLGKASDILPAGSHYGDGP